MPIVKVNIIIKNIEFEGIMKLMIGNRLSFSLKDLSIRLNPEQVELEFLGPSIKNILDVKKEGMQIRIADEIKKEMDKHLTYSALNLNKSLYYMKKTKQS